MTPFQELKTRVAEIISQASGLPISPDMLVVPEAGRGDLALPCFPLAKSAGKPPVEIANEVASAIQPNDTIANAVATGPYINIDIVRALTAELALTPASPKSAREKLLVEYVSPNTNKPLHLGHLRNAALGWSIIKILEANGHEVVKAQIINDRGIHIMKSLLAYQKWGNGETPESVGLKSDHFVGNYYVRFDIESKKNETLKDEAQELLVKWEAGDPDVRAAWQQMNNWALAGMRETYERIGIAFDRNDLESEIYQDGKAIAEEAVTKGLARQREDGAIVMDLDGDQEKVLLRSDGTSVYITQDLALAKKRLAETGAQKMLYVVGQEQDYQFKLLFEALEKLGIATREQLAHISYHLVQLPEGRMKSREGTVVDTDDLVNELHTLAAEEIKQRTPELAADELEHRAETVALAAVKFFMLRVRPNSDIIFDPKASIAFIGHTGPYLLYTYARLQSIFRKVGETNTNTKPAVITDAEWDLLLSLLRFPDAVSKAGELYDPSLVADAAYELSKAINDFYEKEPVLKADAATQAWRLTLLARASETLKHALTLLGIETLDEM